MDAATLQGRIAGTLGRAALALPARVQSALGGPAPAAAPDLAPEARLLARLERMVAKEPSDPMVVTTPAARRSFDAQAIAVGGRPRARVRAQDTTVAGSAGPLRARLYVPESEKSTPAPLLVFFHGGGWVRGSIESHDAPCRVLADLSGARVLSVDYRLAPEATFPAAADDALAAFLDVASRAQDFGADPARLAVGGDSAGGNLAAVAAVSARDAGGPAPAFQLLVYPGCDLSHKHPSIHAFATGYLLSEADTDRYKALYVPDRAQWSDPRASPLLTPDLAGVAPAFVVTAAADPLRDEGEAYAARLTDAGVPAVLHRHPHVHGFMNMASARAARAGLAVMAEALRNSLH
ncbi:MAG: alpha/beta hydrolase [Solirubrobacteraceae bacterium]